MEKRTVLQLANHIVYECIGDNCECCDWPAEDYDAMAAMGLREAEDIVSEAGSGSSIDYENHVDGGRYDLSDDAEALASAGMGTDEDYFFGDTY